MVILSVSNSANEIALSPEIGGISHLTEPVNSVQFQKPLSRTACMLAEQFCSCIAFILSVKLKLSRTSRGKSLRPVVYLLKLL